MRSATRLFILACILFTSAAIAQKPTAKSNFKVDYEKFTLPNGLEVIFHIDRSDPVVAVSLTAHVGSAREKAGRTGFAHFHVSAGFSPAYTLKYKKYSLKPRRIKDQVL